MAGISRRRATSPNRTGLAVDYDDFDLVWADEFTEIGSMSKSGTMTSEAVAGVTTSRSTMKRT